MILVNWIWKIYFGKLNFQNLPWKIWHEILNLENWPWKIKPVKLSLENWICKIDLGELNLQNWSWKIELGKINLENWAWKIQYILGTRILDRQAVRFRSINYTNWGVYLHIYSCPTFLPCKQIPRNIGIKKEITFCSCIYHKYRSNILMRGKSDWMKE